MLVCSVGVMVRCRDVSVVFFYDGLELFAGLQ